MRALIQSGSKDEPVLVIFSHFGRLAGGEDTIISTEAPETYKTAPDEPKEMTRKLKLEKGYNLVVFTAWNQGASADASEAETSRALAGMLSTPLRLALHFVGARSAGCMDNP